MSKPTPGYTQRIEDYVLYQLPAGQIQNWVTLSLDPPAFVYARWLTCDICHAHRAPIVVRNPSFAAFECECSPAAHDAYYSAFR